jgi:hypothetical protein
MHGRFPRRKPLITRVFPGPATTPAAGNVPAATVCLARRPGPGGIVIRTRLPAPSIGGVAGVRPRPPAIHRKTVAPYRGLTLSTRPPWPALPAIPGARPWPSHVVRRDWHDIRLTPRQTRPPANVLFPVPTVVGKTLCFWMSAQNRMNLLMEAQNTIRLAMTACNTIHLGMSDGP